MHDTVTSTPDYNFRFRDAFLGAQTLLIAIGALVMVPMLTGLDPNVALFTAGAGTLLFQAITKGKVPVFLGSSFAFVAPTLYCVQMYGMSAALCGLAMGGVAYFMMAALVYFKGMQTVERLLPPIVTGPVIIAIGLVLAPVAVNMAAGLSGDGSITLFPENTALTLAFISLGVALITRLFARGWMQLIPILSGIAAGYIAAIFYGVIDLTAVSQASWFSFPSFSYPTWHWGSIFIIFPVALVSAVEHVGDILAIGVITKRSYIQSPGLHKTLMGDGLATALAGCLGGPPNTTYSEVTAGVAITRTFNPAIMTWASIIAVLLAFCGKVGIFLQSIPAPIMGGILILLFGTIATIGISILVQSQDDLMEPRNMTIVGIILMIPLGGLTINLGSVHLGGIGLGGILGVALNAILPYPKPKIALTAE